MTVLKYENYHENKTHYDSNFPYNTYLCTIPLDFTQVPIHWHEELELIYIKKGTGIVSINLTPYQVTAGCIAIILPGHLHAIEQLDQQQMEYENIIFDLEMLVSKKPDICTSSFFQPLINNNISLPEMITPQSPYYNELAACLDHADDICRTSPDAYQLAIKSCLFSFFYIIFKNYAFEVASCKDQKSMDKIKFIIKYVEEHYTEHLTVGNIASLTGFSESHFMKFFKNLLGTSFIAYLNDYRLTIASRMLLSSKASIISIAEEAGYDNLSYFNRIFKNKYHMTPSQYRKTVSTRVTYPDT